MNRVHIEFQRVQTWLFAVPRLRAMVGANALLGEVLRVALPDLARREQGWKLATNAESYPFACLDDPLREHDDPAADAKDGILARDGGHFEARFECGADAFGDAAAALIRETLPGLRFRISIDGVERTKRQAEVSTELPVLAPCEWTGRGLASTTIVQGGDERPAVSLDVQRRHGAARRVEDGTSKDIASLLGGKTTCRRPYPADLDTLAGRGYLALIHADGNGVGRHAGDDEGRRAAFFHRNRVLLRKATLTALERAWANDARHASLIPLMLGGDDLLVVCRADKALPFVVDLCAELASAQRNDRSGFELTLGVGVVIAKANIPIHRLHEVVEHLASSAKRRFRGLERAGKRPRSVVDWAVYNSTWVEEPDEVRRRDWLRGPKGDRRVLSQRPIDVLGSELDSLQCLLEAAKCLENAPRSQLRYLVEQLPRGRALTELAFAELSKEAREALERAGIRGDDIWTRTADGGFSVTRLLDLIEIVEIPRLGTNQSGEQRAEETAHG